ncbi:MAG: coproporphyrinogen dehydrogenase HemZ, partial [Desulfobacterales bacterium]|nr:coproporphyrinogen dehydrogenase HemZ [Desulfobacterales bacterium]
SGKTLRSIYIGGGTPTSIDISLLAAIIERVNTLRTSAVELTVEAGRVDTIDDDVLQAFKNLDVNRISINAQTMNDQTLREMNRPHTAQDVIKCISKASHYGFDSINMDLIMGLPGERMDHAEKTLTIVKELPIDNLTVHTLAIKRSSKLKEKMDEYDLSNQSMVEAMVEMSQVTAYQMGMHPYYMYRQKFMSGNLENVGFAKPGKESVYNIDIMEETHNVIALGAGGVSKRMYYDENRHVRLANPKSIDHYIKNIDTLIKKKDKFFS